MKTKIDEGRVKSEDEIDEEIEHFFLAEEKKIKWMVYEIANKIRLLLPEDGNQPKNAKATSPDPNQVVKAIPIKFLMSKYAHNMERSIAWKDIPTDYTPVIQQL
ncbi:MAG: hypothetical protein ACYDAO_04375 [Thermoplasmataceae archaeon]